MKRILLFGLSLALVATSDAQVRTSTFELTGQSKRGVLNSASYSEDGTYNFLYVSQKVTNGFRTVEFYKFDSDFNNVEATTSELDVNAPDNSATDNTVSSNYKGDVIVKNSVAAFQLFGVGLVQVEQTYTWNWDFNLYEATYKIGEFTKVEDPAGEFYNYAHSFDRLQDGGAILVTSVHPEGSKDIENNLKFSFASYASDLSKQSEEFIEFDDPMGVLEGYPIYEVDGIDSTLLGGAIIFAPVQAKIAKNPEKTFTGYDKTGADKTYGFVYVQFDANGKILYQTPFDSETTDWSAKMFHADGDDIYIAGPCNTKKFDEKYMNTGMTMQDMYGNMYASEFQAVKFKAGALQYLTNVSIKDDMAENTYLQNGKKGKKVYNGRQFEVMGYTLTDAGDFMINGVNYGKVDSMGVRADFNEVITIHFAPNGEFKACYSVDPKEKDYGDHPVPNKIVFNADQSAFYWILEENAGLKEDKVWTSNVTNTGGGFSGTYGLISKFKYLLYPRVFRVDVGNGAMSEIELDSKGYFLDNRFPYFEFDDKIVFVGASKNSKTLWLAELLFE